MKGAKQDTHVAISDGFYLEDAPPLGQGIKFTVDTLEELKYLKWFSCRRPCSETYVVVAVRMMNEVSVRQE